MMRWCAVLALLLFAAACGDSITEIVVSVRAERAALEQATGFLVTVRVPVSGGRKTVLHSQLFSEPWPDRDYVLSFTPEDESSFDELEVEAAALYGNMVTASTRQQYRYTKGKSKRYSLVLEAACVKVSCTGAQTCVAGRCVGTDSPSSEDAGVDDANKPPAQPARAVDVLFVIDDSGSMAEEQAILARQLPSFLSGLDALGASLHLGVVTTNMGGIPSTDGSTYAAIVSCDGLGDDARLQQSVQVATEGVVASTSNEFQGYKRGDVVVPADPSCNGLAPPKYQAHEAGSDTGELSKELRCVASLGLRGCPFEQPLEAMWKALAPSRGNGSLYTFNQATRGQADTFNAGFLRPDAVLAVIVLSDEEDCSITDEGQALFDIRKPADDEYGPLNLRCWRYSDRDELVRPVSRYVEGLRSLKPGHPERLVYTLIAGVPEDAIASGLPARQVLDLEAMTFKEDPIAQGFPAPSCGRGGPRTNDAFPPRRMVELADALAGQSVLSSVCASDYGPALQKTLAKIGAGLGAP